MNRLFFSFLFIVFSYGNAFNEWIEINKKLLKHKNKLITFNLTRNGDRDEVLYVKIALGHNKIFRFERGNRTVISNGKLWKSYDSDTNQIFIQDRDVRLEKLLFSWSKYKKIKSLKFKKQSNGSFEIKIPGLKQEIYSFFNSESNSLDSILSINQNRYVFSNIEISKLDSINLKIGLDTTEIFDLR